MSNLCQHHPSCCLIQNLSFADRFKIYVSRSICPIIEHVLAYNQQVHRYPERAENAVQTRHLGDAVSYIGFYHQQIDIAFFTRLSPAVGPKQYDLSRLSGFSK